MDTITFFHMQGSILGLYDRGGLADDVGVSEVGSGFRGVTVALNVASNDEVDAVFAEWVEAGATPVKAPEEVFWGGYSSYVADPDGHLWEIAHNPHAAIGEDGTLQIGDPAT